MAWARATQLLGKREHRRCDRAEAATALPRRMAIAVHEAMLVASFACHRNVRGRIDLWNCVARWRQSVW